MANSESMPGDEQTPLDDAVPLGTEAQEPRSILELLKDGQKKPGRLRELGHRRFRNGKRHDCGTPVAITIDDPARPERAVPIRDAVTVDVSAGGLSFVSSVLLTPGTRLRLQFADSQDAAPIVVVVRHCTCSQPGRFTTGVQILDE